MNLIERLNVILLMTGKIMLLSVVVSLMHAVKADVQDPKTENKALHQLFDQEWQHRKATDPEVAAGAGESVFLSQLEDVSEQAQQQQLKATIGFLNQLAKIGFNELSSDDQINYQIFKQQLVNRRANLEFKDYQIPFLADYGFHTYIARLPVETEFSKLSDYQNYLQRLTHIPVYFEQNIDNMNNGLARGFSMPSVVMIGFSEVIKKQLVKKVEDSAFYGPFIQISKNISKKEQQQLRVSARKIIAKQVIPAYNNLFDYFEQVYIPNTKQSLGAFQFPQGKAYYQHKITQYTTGTLTPKQIHEIGLKEVKRIRAEMEDIIKQVKFEGSFKEFLTFLRTSDQFYAKTAKDLLKEASYIAKKMDGKLPQFFTKLPRQPYTVEAVPDAIAPKYTTGRYLSAPLKSTRPGTYWVNTYALDKRPLYVLESLTLHEAVPGHHLQGALNQELDNLPNFRRYSYISAFGEGWALYCEKLGLEAGFYQDPYSDFGRLSYEMWRAARLVIDTGIHAFGWTRDQAIELLEENSALSTHNIRTEVDRYISWPGQALSYKLGELKILELRQMAETRLADNFDIRLFHDAILANGSVPLDVLERQMNLFVKQQLAISKTKDD